MTATPNTAALEALLMKVEAGEWPDQLFSGTVIGYHNDSLAMDAFLGSIDAAKELHEAVADQWTAIEIRSHARRTSWTVELMRMNGDHEEMEVGRSHHSPARAWLIALIRAIIAAPPPKPQETP